MKQIGPQAGSSTSAPDYLDWVMSKAAGLGLTWTWDPRIGLVVVDPAAELLVAPDGGPGTVVVPKTTYTGNRTAAADLLFAEVVAGLRKARTARVAADAARPQISRAGADQFAPFFDQAGRHIADKSG
jgi:hypothetical protein